MSGKSGNHNHSIGKEIAEHVGSHAAGHAIGGSAGGFAAGLFHVGKVNENDGSQAERQINEGLRNGSIRKP